jgi:hypothetical protein
MNQTNIKILSLSTALLLCLGSLALAARPDGKGKPPKGNQPVDATVSFYMGDIISNGLLLAELINNGDFDTLDGQLAGGETIAVAGDAGAALVFWCLIKPYPRRLALRV